MHKPNGSLKNPRMENPGCTGTHHCCCSKPSDAVLYDDKAKIYPIPWHQSNLKMHPQHKSLEDNSDVMYPSRFNKCPKFETNELKKYLKRYVSDQDLVGWDEKDEREMEEHILNMLAALSGNDNILDCLSRVQEICLNGDEDLLELIIRLKRCARSRFGSYNQQGNRNLEYCHCPSSSKQVCQRCFQNKCTCFGNNDNSLRGGQDPNHEHSNILGEDKDIRVCDSRPIYSGLEQTNCNQDYDQSENRNRLKACHNNNGRTFLHYRTTQQRDFTGDKHFFICPTCHQRMGYKTHNGNVFIQERLPDTFDDNCEDSGMDGLLPPKIRSPTRRYKAYDSVMDLKGRYNSKY